MVEPIRAFITEVDEAGTSRFRSTDVIQPVLVRTPVGHGDMERTGTLWQIWGTSDAIPSFHDPAEPVLSSGFPGPGGTRFAIFSLPPDSSFTPSADRKGDESGDDLGIAGTHEAGADAAFHATNSIDYLFVIEGEIVVELDKGRRELVTQGNCIVQRGTRHAWRNESSKPVVFASVVVGVQGGL